MIRIEYKRYDKAALEIMARHSAMMALVADIYYGEISEQTIRWLDDGSVEVFTHHEPRDSETGRKP